MREARCASERDRERAKIGAGDKLALVSMEKDGEICCLSLIKVEKLESMVKSMLVQSWMKFLRDSDILTKLF